MYDYLKPRDGAVVDGLVQSRAKRGYMKITPELKKILERCAKEVSSWPKWKRTNVDPCGQKDL